MSSAIRDLTEALRDLCDIQNGPPLIQYKNEWESAMENAYRALDKVERNTPFIELGVEGDQPYFKIDNQTFFVGSEPEEPFWYVDMMRKAFEKLGVEIK